jgi:amino acid transporter
VDLNPRITPQMTMFFVIWPAFSFLFAVLSTAFSGEIKNVSRGQLLAIPAAQAFGGMLILFTGLLARLAISKEGLLAIGWVSSVTPEKFPLPYAWINSLASIMADNILLTIIINVSVTILTMYVAASTAVYATRGLLAWGVDGMAPAWVAKVSERTHAPVNSVLTVGALGIIWLAIFSYTDWFRAVAVLVPMGFVFLVTTFVAALFPFLKREVYQASPARIEIAGIPLMTITGLLGSAIMAWIVYRAVVDVDYGAFTPQSLMWWLLIFAARAWTWTRASRRSRSNRRGRRRAECPPLIRSSRIEQLQSDQTSRSQVPDLSGAATIRGVAGFGASEGPATPDCQGPPRGGPHALWHRLRRQVHWGNAATNSALMRNSGR